VSLFVFFDLHFAKTAFCSRLNFFVPPGIFTIYGIKAMTKSLYDHVLTRYRGFAQGQHFYQKSFSLFEIFFFTFTAFIINLFFLI